MKFILSVLWTIVWGFLGYAVFMPVLSFSFGAGIYGYLIIYFAVLAVILYDSDEERSLYKSVIPLIGVVILFVAMLIGGISSWSLFHASDYRNMIGSVKEQKFTANVAPVSPEQMLTVDQSIAERIGGKVLGEDPGLGSRCELGEFTLQVVKGHLYWIAPLLHSGFFKWSGNDTTPGYVVVNATDERDYRLVKEVNGKPISLRYQPNAYWGDDLERHIYMSGYMNVGLTDFTFEVDDNWQPYWTVSTYDSKVGFLGDNVTAMLVVDPSTGIITQHTLEKTPSWIDRIQPQNFVSTQINDWGDLIHGYWNWSGKDKLHSADESSVVLGSDNQMYYYFGLQSKGAEQGTVGFMMVNCRTKESTWIKQAGATEDAAKASAEGAVQEKGYTGSDGITYNVAGYATYEFLLKDKAGLMKSIALVNVHDHNVVGVGTDRLTAIRNYLTKMNSRGNAAIGEESNLELVTFEGVVTRFNGEVNSGNTIYYFMIEGNKNQFFGTSSISTEFCLTKPNDRVKVTFIQTNGEVEVKSFDNVAIGIPLSVAEKKVLQETDSISGEKLVKEQGKVADQKWENLTPAEKAKLLNNK